MTNYPDHIRIAQTLLDQQGQIQELTQERDGIRAATLNEGIDLLVAEIWRGSQFSQEDARHPGLCEAVDVLRRITDEAQPPDKLAAVLAEVRAERARQDAQFGEQNHPMLRGTHNNTLLFSHIAEDLRNLNAKPEELCWLTILLEEAYEAGAETDPAKARAELVQVAAVAVAAIQAIDRNAPTFTNKPQETTP